MSELSSEFERLQARLAEAYVTGGLDACRALVGELAVIAGMAETMADAAVEVDHGTIMEADDLPVETVHERRAMTDGVERDGISAAALHSLGLFILSHFERIEREMAEYN